MAGLPSSAYTTLGGDRGGCDTLPLCRLVTGLWQTGDAHGYAPEASAVAREMALLVERGFSSFDAGDARGDAERFFGAFRQLVGRASADEHAQCATQIVLDAAAEKRVGRREVEARVDAALARLRADRVDLLQLHWPDGRADARFLDVLATLGDLRRAGKIRCIGLVNFPTVALATAAKQGLAFDSNLVPYSLLDRRPDKSMATWCAENGVALLAYSTVGGGFLCDRYLGVPEPTRRACATPSLARYAKVIRAWGGWSLFQELLFALKVIAEKYSVSIANVAVRWVLEQRAVAAVIVGARLGFGPEADHFADNARVFKFELDDEDRKLIEEVSSRANDLYQILGEVGSEFQSPLDPM